MKFYFVLSGYFPTNKAYGVTTNGTIKALKKEGHEVSVVSRAELKTKMRGYGYLGRLAVRSSDYLHSSHLLSKWYFPIWQIICSMMSISFFIETKSVIWVREPKLALIFSKITRKQVICELHQVSGIFIKLYIWLLKRNPRVILAPIKTELMQRAHLSTLDCPIAFMAVEEEFLQAGHHRSVGRKLLPQIAIVANLSNKYQIQSFKRLLTQIDFCLSVQEGVRFYFAGIHKDAVSDMKLSIENIDNVKFLGRISHEQILSLLSNTDLGIIPYCENDYFSNTFPIKAVEYAATKNLIIASDTSAHRELMRDHALFYDLNDNLGLNKAIRVALSDSEEIEKVLTSAYDWAKRHSYQERVLGVLKKISVLS